MPNYNKTENNPNALSPKEQLFVSSYLIHFNGTRAALDAGYTKSKDSARFFGSEVLAKPHVRKEIDAYLAERRLSAVEALDRLSKMARTEMTDLAVPVSAENVDSVKFQLYEIDPETNQLVAKQSAKFIRRMKIKKRVTTTRSGDTTEEVETDLELYNAQDANEKMLKVHKVFEKGIEPTAQAVSPLPAIPADLIAPDFLSVYRDIKQRKHVEYVLRGGRGSTKSSFASIVGVIFTIVNNPDIHGLVVRKTANTLRESVFNQLLWAIEELGLSDLFRSTVSPLSITYLPTQQKIYFRGANDPTRIKSIKPKFGYIGVLWFEELDQFHGPEEIRKIEQSAIRGGEIAIIIKSFNPPRTAQSWVNKYCLVPKENQLQHSSSYLTVPPEWLGPTFFAEAEHLKATNPDAYAHEYLGEVNGTGGQVFTNVIVRPITDEEIKEFDNVLRGADWGYFPDPFSFGKMHYDSARRKLYIYDEYRAFRKGNEFVADELQQQGKIEPGELLIADSSEPKSVKDFQAYGLNCIGAEKGPESRYYSYKWLQSLAEIVIDSVRAPEHAKEFLACEYMQDKDGNYITDYPDKDDHAIDDTRYGTNRIWRKRGQ